MPSSISEDLKRTFGIAALRKEAAKILNAQEWKELQAIKKRYADQTNFEKRSFALEYEGRVETMRRRLINQAGEKNTDHKPRFFGVDKFDKAAINRQAERLVRNQHYQVLGHLENQEIREVESLMARCEQRQHQREKPIRDFNRAADRRRGERRQTRTRQ